MTDDVEEKIDFQNLISSDKYFERDTARLLGNTEKGHLSQIGEGVEGEL